MSSFFDYERDNNRLLKLIRENPSYKDVLNFVTINEASILAPQNVTLDNVSITRSFIETHVVLINPNDQNQFVSMNGILGVISPEQETLHIISFAHHSPSFNPLVDLKILFDSEKDLFKNYVVNPKASHIHALRRGQVNFDGKSLVSLILISEPLSYDGCDWKNVKSAEQTQQQLKTHRKTESKDFLSFTSRAVGMKPKGLRDFLKQFGTQTSSAPLFPETQESEAEIEKRNAKENSGSQKANTFFSKLKQPQATDIVKSIKSFIANYLNQPHESMKEQSFKIHSYLSTLETVIHGHPLWKDATDEELDGVSEGLEKYVLTKVYTNIFTSHCGHRDDDTLTRRIAQLKFIAPEHLDIKPQFINEASVQLSCNELRKINDYKAPRDKMICILNCCKVIYNMLNKASKEGTPPGADDFLPLLIYIVLQANPTHLHTNIQYISHFRNQSKMISEIGYYFTHLVSATHFINTLDSSCLSIDPAEFQRKMEAPVRTIEAAAAVPPLFAAADAQKLTPELPKAETTTPTATTPITTPREISVEPAAPLLDLMSFDPSPAVVTLVATPPSRSNVDHSLYRFMEVGVDELKLGDVAELLRAYKCLAEENQSLKTFIRDKGFELPLNKR